MFENIRSDPLMHFGPEAKALSQTHVIITVDLTKSFVGIDTEHQPLCRREAVGVFAEILCLPKGQNYILALAVYTLILCLPKGHNYILALAVCTFTANAAATCSMEATLCIR